MVTIRNIDETFRFYGSFGAKQMDVGNGTCFTFPDNSYIRFWGDLHGFCVTAVDFTPPEDAIFRSQICSDTLASASMRKGIMSVICENPTPEIPLPESAALFSLPQRPIS